MKRQIFDNIPSYVHRGISLLEGSGFCAYLVGGSLRDLLLGKEPKDYDLATDATPQEILEVFQEFSSHKVGAAFGTVGVCIEGKWMEVTTFREEMGYSDHRRPDQVKYSKSLLQDLKRRDFRINAMAWNKKEFVDPFQGKKDLKHQCICAVGKPAERFREDPLRILRGLRLSAVLGFTMEETTLQAMRDEIGGLSYISKERIRVEILELLGAKGGLKVLTEHFSLVFHTFSPLLKRADFMVEKLTAIRSFDPNPFVNLGYLLLFLEEDERKQVLQQFVLSSKEEQMIVQGMIRVLEGHNRDENPGKLLQAMGREGLFFWISLKDLFEGTNQRDILMKRVDAYLQAGGIYKISQLAIDGRHLTSLGLKGKDVGEALERALDFVIQGLVPNKKEELLYVVKKTGKLL